MPWANALLLDYYGSPYSFIERGDVVKEHSHDAMQVGSYSGGCGGIAETGKPGFDASDIYHGRRTLLLEKS
jgi:hypothetical protein